jgi:hypothetical protein
MWGLQIKGDIRVSEHTQTLVKGSFSVGRERSSHLRNEDEDERMIVKFRSTIGTTILVIRIVLKLIKIYILIHSDNETFHSVMQSSKV